MSGPSPSGSARQTDVRRRTVLPTTLQNLRSAASSAAAELDLPSDEYLDKLEEELNRKVDQEVEGLVEGFKELIALARLRTQQMLRNAHQLLGLCHELKLLHLFGDERTRVGVREAKARAADEAIAEQRRRVEELAGRSAAQRG
ncbi:SPOSA6832_04960 [Sporobolomyces salmonicolor]|uniref:SPOSA6832_04960-mRNA-1:cds n=1 Tax=Sporidiobolus salmonicolor TaxID=5005 RepID=A0A0D6ESG5_SPOSA|nr:SPOSA6832_04960 [Sporobolomyces salmonicolor]